MSQHLADLLAAARAQLDRDERVALASNPARHREIVTEVLHTGKLGSHLQAAHIARWNPERVLAITASRRKVLDELEVLQAARPLTAEAIALALAEMLAEGPER